MTKSGEAQPAATRQPRTSPRFDRELGRTIRELRHACELSLPEVEAMSEGEFKASALSAYERGERSLTVARFVRLAEFYGVDAADLLRRRPRAAGTVRSQASVVAMADRRQANGRSPDDDHILIRRREVDIVGALLGLTPDEVADRLRDLGDGDGIEADGTAI